MVCGDAIGVHRKKQLSKRQAFRFTKAINYQLKRIVQLTIRLHYQHVLSSLRHWVGSDDKVNHVGCCYTKDFVITRRPHWFRLLSLICPNLQNKWVSNKQVLSDRGALVVQVGCSLVPYSKTIKEHMIVTAAQENREPHPIRNPINPTKISYQNASPRSHLWPCFPRRTLVKFHIPLAKVEQWVDR